MLNQSFTQENLRKIYDAENRKGDYIEKGFPSEIREVSLAIKRWRRIKRSLNKRKDKYSEEIYQARLKKIRDAINSHEAGRDYIINSRLEEASQNISKKTFKLKIEKHFSSHHGKQVYCVKPGIESFFAEKQVQKNIKTTYNVKQASRDVIISQIISVLSDNFPKQIIRTDISSFYESIDRNFLKDRISKNPELSLASRKMIEQVMRDYEKITQSQKGIPRGVGISAYLSELYMSGADEMIKALPGVVYYTRYVDDIVVIFSPLKSYRVEDRKEMVSSIMSDIGLSLNEENQQKTKLIAFKKGVDYSFEYLGYKIQHHAKKVKVGASKDKIKKYKARIDCAFESYRKSYGSENDKKLLVNRIRFLTGNTKLANNKSGTFVGIYSSNRWIDDLSFLDQLDHYLGLRASGVTSQTLQRRVLKLSFRDGFENKVFRSFSTRDLGKITQVWRR
ncbi:RNA-directed DNA polymerase [Halomonas sp. M5N1S17]|uniref:antiviral reverse transcriptase Drt3a n=1 Tax=Halomonas alkalisoli TaxID=2907158 RepID=UPI001F2C7C15|nr:antiviral reverse transcriptase Drt3a [Halomonas alkalisoli]MCE9663258.1 RNA-directed DNA polymerase [Halomonas alkalisoli]